ADRGEAAGGTRGRFGFHRRPRPGWLGRRGGQRRQRRGGSATRTAPCLLRERPDHLVDLRIQTVNAQQRLPLAGRRRVVAAVPRQLAAGEQVEDQILLLRRRLDREILRGAHGERERQLLAQPAAPVGRRRRVRRARN